jgi:hypothetical protein
MRYHRYISGPDDLPGRYTVEDARQNYGASYEECDACNYGRHNCHGCGDDLNHDGTEFCAYGPERMHGNCLED